MRPLFKLFTAALLSIPVLVGCGNSDSPFTENGGSSSTNIISAANFGVTASELNPNVIEFAIGSVPNPTSDKTADSSGVLFSFSPIDSVITVTAADNSGALVSTGTVFFETQYGILSESSCELKDGRCTVTWQSVAELSQLDVPGSPSLIDIVNVVTVWTFGEEGFTDLDGDRRLSISSSGIIENFFDTDSPFLDRNDNQVYDAANDNILATSEYETINNLYDGPSCDANTRTDCGTSRLVPIYDYVYLRLNFDSSTTNAFSVIIDTPITGDTVLLGDSINFTATAEDPEDGTIIGNGDPLPNNNIVWNSDVDGNLTGNTNDINISTLSAGTHTITVTASDDDLNTVSDTISIYITSPPAVTIDAPATGSTVTTGVIINFTATATDAEDGTIIGTDDPVAGVDISWSSDIDGALGTNSNSISDALTTLGAHIITVTVTDSDTNVSTATINLTVQ